MTGRVRGTLEASGYLFDPSLSGFLSFENIVTQDADLESFSASFLVNSVVSVALWTVSCGGFKWSLK